MSKINDSFNKYKPIPFWSWNAELDPSTLVEQIKWMKDSGIGGFFMHARGGLKTEYLGEDWFNCVETCLEKAKELNMSAYAYDENGWPSGFAGGKLLEDLNNHDQYLTCKIGIYDSNSFVSYSLDSDKLIRTTSGERVLNIYLHNSTSTADIANPDVVKKFIELTHEQYKKHDKNHVLKGFFTDEPQYYRWATPYTKMVKKYFKDNYDIDILDYLGLLFVEKEGYRSFRYKYWLAMQQLVLNNFAKQIYDWCDENNYYLTGHFVEENSLGKQMCACAGVMPFYEYEHIPGCDWLTRAIDYELNPKQLGSAAQQLGKKQTIAECFACVGWDASPLELKHIAEFLMVNGVNLICHHLLPYSELGQRKRDYPEHYTKFNSWVNKDFLGFNDYFTHLGSFLSESKEIVDVGIFHPMRSCYFNFKRDLQAEDMTGFGIQEIDDAFEDTLWLFSSQQIPHHLIDETLLEKYGSVKDGKLIVGKCSYSFLVLPKIIYTISKKNTELLKEFVKQGGKLLLLGEKPLYMEGEPFDFDFLESNITLDDILDSLDYKVNARRYISSSYRIDKNGNKFLYVVNLDDKANSISFRLKGFKSFNHDGKIISTFLSFDPYESKVLYFSNEEPSKTNKNFPLFLGNELTIEKPVINYLVLDKASYSLNNMDNFGKDKNVMAIFNDLLKKRFNGEVYLKFRFNVDEVPTNCNALIENTNIKEVLINGNHISPIGYVIEKDLEEYNIAQYLYVGKNEITIKMHFYESPQVYYALFGEDVQEGLKNCLVYDSTIEAIYLRGIFGVRNNAVEGNEPYTYVANHFGLKKQPSKICNLIKDGFPFFTGTISLSQVIYLDETNKDLILDKRYHLVDIYVNDVFVKHCMFDYRVDLSSYLVKGYNKICFVETFGLRNILGPFHQNKEEPLLVDPSSFERMGSWNDEGESTFFNKRYSFVKHMF